MATWVRHRCGECGQPVINRKALEWVHVNRGIEHEVKNIQVEKWEAA